MTEPIIVSNADQLRSALSAAKPGAVIQLTTGVYPGTYTLSKPGVTLESFPGDIPKFTGPAKPTPGSKPVWLKIAPTAKGATVRYLALERLGDIAKAKDYNDFGIVISAPDVTVDTCKLAGMTKGIMVEGKDSVNVSVIRCHIGPTYQANIVVGTSYGVMRALLIGWNTLEESYIEDGIQCVQNFSPDVDQLTDVSNLGVILYGNMIDRMGENGIDLKGAAYVVAEGNTLRHIAGSNDGPLEGWEPNSPMSIMHGANASKGQICQVLIRNNDIQECAGGTRIFAGWHGIHNTIISNNFSKSPEKHNGIGILQDGDPTGAAIKNNLVAGNDGGDLRFSSNSPEFINNPPFVGAGVSLTATRADGSGRMLPLLDAGYFTDWFGRTDLPPDVLYLLTERYEVQDVDYDDNMVRLDRDAQWQKGDPVFWRSPQPGVGFQVEYTPEEPTEPPVEPPIEPPVEPPPVESVTITLKLSVEATPEQAAAIKEAVEAGTVTVEVEYNGVTVTGAVESDA